MSERTNSPFTATVLGAPRIGPRRELKRAIEGYWAGRVDAAELEATAAGLRADTIAQLSAAGLDSIPVNTFSYYDQVLDTAVMLGALPERVAAISDPLDRYFAAARGTADVAPLEMTKWFDTNYHYLVPEIGPDTTFTLNPEKVLAEVAEARTAGVNARPVVVGPITFLALSKPIGAGSPLDRINELLPCYLELLRVLAEAGVEWVQIDEPALVTDIASGLPALAGSVYSALAQASARPKILVATYFGDAGEALPALARSGVDGVAVDLIEGRLESVVDVPELSRLHVVAGVVDGRNIWRTDLEKALATLGTLLGSTGSLAVSTSCSTLHVPYSLEPETELDDNLRGWLAFGAEKYTEVATLSRALTGGREAEAAAFDACAAALATRATDPRVHVDAVRERLAAVNDADVTRGEAATRLAAQNERLNLPALPTTTIGSYPQTSAIRLARAALRKGEIDQAGYEQKMRDEIKSVVDLQEQIGLDVLVHGEPERNDMVQYFAEQLDGFFATVNGWVQSYGTRCVRPPILFGDVVRPRPMTVDWITFAQTLTAKPVKGMLTGPVTILAWSFVRNDQPLSESADQIALAIRDETVDLEKAGVGIIQVDEPALRELLPLRNADKQAYLDWAVRAFRLSTAGVEDATQIHTHLCYSEFGEVIGAIAELDADVTSIEAARSHMEVLDDLNSVGFANAVGPGVYDIHSPRVPGTSEIETSLAEALKAVGPQRLWVNPDCGLKTRTTDEVTEALTNMVAAAKSVRAGA
ncbi:5-methyltetrahydropteroyltriglutamate--homocysteine S-methyltransferase [Gordonia sp. NB41Y]|uniref:5-methyltetrahydropteroyltriglutamate-- homocysteine S-methyltransferase n=1 Tax=Gordonia sp. NB41Y TaxID=875808 RepID=UPI00034A8759|nr:5-methyltetrahydropteroyltriglutamate--homocysteine S-methyltransferase [Gordonia sp. NB41Y]EMP12702.2 5-methyltetrahydropteroyltriglutamate--homocysteine methyltransferase [Gordonia sp. NB41Y]WLP91505.1 5-methyltetrahydropteroyltriglutamate--homocysteine S-methyltransferase [Gordonia sp. NB41Y]